MAAAAANNLPTVTETQCGAGTGQHACCMHSRATAPALGDHHCSDADFAANAASDQEAAKCQLDPVVT
jgi:hypothetical protein